MARLTLDLPAQFAFSIDLPVRIADINYGGHLGNDAVLRFAHEVRLAFLRQHGYSEMDIHGVGLIMGDAAVVYRSEAFHGEVLKVEVAISDVGRCGFDFVYRLSVAGSGREVAQVKTGMVCFDYTARKVRPCPAEFLTRCGVLA